MNFSSINLVNHTYHTLVFQTKIVAISVAYFLKLNCKQIKYSNQILNLAEMIVKLHAIVLFNQMLILPVNV